MENPGNNDEQNTNSQHTVSEKIRYYILKNPWFVLWNLSLLVGGIIFWLYFFQIGYFPDLTGDESIILFPLVAITGVFSLLLMILIFMWPSYFRFVILNSKRTVSSELIPLSEERRENNNYELVWCFLSIFLLYAAYFFS